MAETMAQAPRAAYAHGCPPPATTVVRVRSWTGRKRPSSKRGQAAVLDGSVRLDAATEPMAGRDGTGGAQRAALPKRVHYKCTHLADANASMLADANASMLATIGRGQS